MCGQIRQHIYRDKPVNVWTGVRVDGCEQVLCANVFYLVQCGNKNVQKGDDRSDFFFKPSLKWFYPSARLRDTKPNHHQGPLWQLRQGQRFFG